MKFANENQRLVIVSGKGGVGKSVVAAALAQKYAAAGENTLLVELGEDSYFENVYDNSVTSRPTLVQPNLSVCIWSGESCLKEYVSHLLKVERLTKIFFENKIMNAFLQAAPALKELAILGKLTSGIRKWGPAFNYDRVVLDAYSTGHMLALLRAPMGMAELVDVGPMGEQSRAIMDVLRRPDLCQIVLVTLLEELPTTEALELRKEIYGILAYHPAIICNREYRPGLTAHEFGALAANEDQAGAREFVAYLKNILKRQAECEDLLKRELGDSEANNQVHLPLVFSPIAREVISQLQVAL